MPAMRPSASGNCGGCPRCSSPAYGRRIRLRYTPGTLLSRRALRDSSSTAVPGPIPTEPESCLGQEPVSLSSVASVAVRQTLNVILLDELLSKLLLVGRSLIRHVEHLVARAYKLFRVAVTVDAPVHVQRVFFERERHQVHPAVTGGAPDALVDVNAVIEIYEIRKIVDARPFERLAAPETGSHRLQDLCVRPNLRVAAHADFRGRNAGEGGRLNRGVAIPAIDPVVGNVMLVAEGDWLRFYNLNIRDVGAAVHRIREGDQATHSKYCTSKAYFRNRVRASMEDLGHAD